MADRKIFILCQCCAMKLANDEESAFRDYHCHDHAALDVPAGTVLSQGPHIWDGTLDLTCHGHAEEVVHPGQTFWVAEVVR